MTMSSGTSSVDGAGYAAQKAVDNGAPMWLGSVIFVLCAFCFCVCESARHSPTTRKIKARSALDQEAVSFIEPEATE